MAGERQDLFLINTDNFLVESDNRINPCPWVDHGYTAKRFSSLNSHVRPIASKHTNYLDSNGLLTLHTKVLMLKQLLKVHAFAQHLRNRAAFSDDELSKIAGAHNSGDPLQNCKLFLQRAGISSAKQAAADDLLEQAHYHFIFWERMFQLQAAALAPVADMAEISCLRAILFWLSTSDNFLMTSTTVLGFELREYSSWLPGVAQGSVFYEPVNRVTCRPNIDDGPFYHSETRNDLVAALLKRDTILCIPKKRTDAETSALRVAEGLLAGNCLAVRQYEHRYRQFVFEALTRLGLARAVARASNPLEVKPFPCLFAFGRTGAAGAYYVALKREEKSRRTKAAP